MDDVQTPVEETTATPSVEEQTTNETQETPAVESNGTETQVSPSVPYERFKEVNDEVKTLREQVSQIISSQPQVQTPQYQPTELDPDAALAVKQIYEQQKEVEFEAKHAKAFDADPLLRAQYLVASQEAIKQANGRYIDRDSVFEAAKNLIDTRVNPKVEQAKQEGVKEGQDIAKTKQQLGAVGVPGKIPETSDDDLSPVEYAKKYNIPGADRLRR